MGFLISLIIVLLIGCVVFWCAKALIGAFKIPDPFGTVILVLIVLVILLWALGYSGLPQGELRFPR